MIRQYFVDEDDTVPQKVSYASQVGCSLNIMSKCSKISHGTFVHINIYVS